MEEGAEPAPLTHEEKQAFVAGVWGWMSEGEREGGMERRRREGERKEGGREGGGKEGREERAYDKKRKHHNGEV